MCALKRIVDVHNFLRMLVRILSLSGYDYTTYEMESKEAEEKGEKWGEENKVWGEEGRFWVGFKDHTSDGRYKMESKEGEEKGEEWWEKFEGVADLMSDSRYV